MLHVNSCGAGCVMPVDPVSLVRNQTEKKSV